MTEEITIPADISTALGPLTKKHAEIVRRMLKTLGEERTRNLLAEAQTVEASGGRPMREAAPGSLRAIMFDLLQVRSNAEEQAFIYGVPAPSIPLNPIAQVLADEIGGVKGKQRAVLNRLVETIGEQPIRRLMAQAAERLKALQEQPPDPSTPKTLRGVLWSMLSDFLDPRTRSIVLQVPFTPPPPSPIPPRMRAQRIADRLGETDPKIVQQITRHILWLGAEPVEAMAARAERIEAAGGMMLPNGSRRRTVGGIFFFIMREAYPALFPSGFRKTRAAAKADAKADSSEQQARSAPAFPPFVWEQRKAIYAELAAQRGEARTVKIMLIGRPGKIVERDHVVITSIRQEKPPPVPKGVPTPIPTTYSVYIARKQWIKIKGAIANPEDVLVVEGVASYDPDMEGIVISATAVTTRLTQQAKREAQLAAAQSSASQEPQP